ncbi:MAG: RrF2 family transcriptional regulator [Olsenella sp.]|nr:RrF2 family transcriptional regulator [Olsenella sp.]
MAGMFSTKGRYALRVMADLANHEGWVSLGDIAERQGISRKYLEQVMALLLKAGYVESTRGKSGGYRLAQPAEEYTLGNILRAVEGTLAPVACLDCTSGEICPRVEDCPTVDVWRDLGSVTSAYLNEKRLSDLITE